MHRLKRAGLNVGLVALAHGPPAVEKAFRARARKLGLADRILQLPFLPHWRVPEFLRGCLAVCCLEQDFPIGFHSPDHPARGAAVRHVPGRLDRGDPQASGYGRLPHGYGCVAIEDVNDIDLLSERLARIVRDPARAAIVGRRGHAYAHELQQDLSFPDRVEAILETATTGAEGAVETRAAEEIDHPAGCEHFPLTRIATATIGGLEQHADPAARDVIDAARASHVLAALERRIAQGDLRLRTLAAAVGTEVAIAAAERESCDAREAEDPDPLFRLQSRDWMVADISPLVAVRDPRIRLLEFDVDVAEFLGARSAAELPAQPAARRSHVVVFRGPGADRDDPLVVDEMTAHILRLSDGTRTARALAEQLDRGTAGSGANNNLKWIERLFLHGLIRLRERGAQDGAAGPSGTASRRRIRGFDRTPSRRRRGG